MGHFGRRPIQLVVVRARAARRCCSTTSARPRCCSTTREAIESPFYRLAPEWAITPLAVLATMATVIASQALISGAFSLTVQAVQLDYLPRLDDPPHLARATSARSTCPLVNWLLMIGCVGLVHRLPDLQQPRRRLRHRGHDDDGHHDAALLPSSRATAGAGRWPKALAVDVPLLVVDLAFLAANIPKIPHGGWFPLLIGVVLSCR